MANIDLARPSTDGASSIETDCNNNKKPFNLFGQIVFKSSKLDLGIQCIVSMKHDDLFVIAQSYKIAIFNPFKEHQTYYVNCM